MDINKLLELTNEKKASDLHITTGIPPMVRINGDLQPLSLPSLGPEDSKEIVEQLLKKDKSIYERFLEKGEVDFSFAVPQLGRYRVNVFKQRGTYAAALRTVGIHIPTMEALGLPTPILKSLADNARGLILVTGPTGSGKSTTLATMINYINDSKKCHVLTLEDPIEYLHKHKNSIVNQREIGIDSRSYGEALRAALREDPDVILVGEMRDQETISTAITAAETGHLVLSTLHTIGAPQTIDRIIDVFPPHQQQQIKVQLANILKGVLSQQLLPRYDVKGRCVALEIMINNPAITNLIREGKTHQIYSQIQTGGLSGMVTMDSSIAKLYKEGRISLETANQYAQIKDELKRLLERR
ncbi:type IV pili twitching motility protein PilT [Sporanaerobium hydrogeniformans]|uniref:Type IV pili twitching motility protein PilT n=1 Tax=Sporanaerobium hydrogeniformans TaxID=3072179 RepID=A0AC61DHA8_9FIRM|nr:type IV pilus twitching motility protein PilT [Sporanaerobium hydrogeniformans]PHV72333.1 type IV pili twitching motility protein PilT [Sporanaerobium hydrogeniformans]